MHPITPDHATEAKAWFDAHRDHPVFQHKVKNRTEITDMIKRNPATLIVYSSERCLMCRGFFRQFIEAITTESYDVLADVPVVIADIDVYPEFFEYLKTKNLLDIPEDAVGLPVVSFFIRTTGIFCISGYSESFCAKIMDVMIRTLTDAVNS